MYILIFSVGYHVPVHSDDYSYIMRGLSFRAQLHQYLRWNGRFLVNYIASIFLNLLKRWQYMAVNAFVFLVLMILITVLPNIIMRKKLINKRSFVILWLVFTVYWLANPNLGQTSFWFVGSVNYLWTLVWAGIFFSFFLYLLINHLKLSTGRAVILSVLGFFAGLSTESLGVTVILFVMCMFPLFWKENKPTLFTGFISTGIGYAILFFSPGLDVRSGSDAFEQWRNLSAFGKFLEHVYNRMPTAFGRFYFMYIVTIVVLIAVLWIRNGKETDGRLFSFPLIFTLLSFLSLFAYIIAPFMPPRSQNVCVFYGLLALSFTAAFLVDPEIRKGGFAVYAVTLFCLLYFIPSFLFVSYAFRQTKVQGEIRESIIQREKAAGKSEVTIPDWYFTRLLKNGDKFDIFRPKSMEEYYKLKTINWRDVEFNYASIQKLSPVNINKELMEGLTLNNVYVNLNPPFEQTLVFEFNKDLRDFCENEEKVLFLHLFPEGSDETTDVSISLNNSIQYGDTYFYGYTFLTPEIKNLDKIEYGLHDPDTKTTTARFSLDLKQYFNRGK